LIVAIVVAGAAALVLDVDVRPVAIRDALRDSGAWGPLLFWIAFALGELIAIPSVLFVIAAGLTWPTEQALVFAWLGCVFAATAVFVVARYAARGFAQGRLPAALRDLDRRVEKRGLWTVVVVRLLTYLHPAVHAALAVSSVRARDYVIGTALGVVPLTTALVVFGEQFAEGIGAVPNWVWATAVVAAFAWTARAVNQRRRKADGTRAEPPDPLSEEGSDS
jgi:uncharacterized membrane protein YdjX (TVP38/TMEM64 family)